MPMLPYLATVGEGFLVPQVHQKLRTKTPFKNNNFGQAIAVLMKERKHKATIYYSSSFSQTDELQLRLRILKDHAIRTKGVAEWQKSCWVHVP